MNTDTIEGAWKSLKGRIREQWGKLTDDDVDRVEGRWDRLQGLIQERYGHAREDVELEVRRFRDKYDRSDQPL